MAVKHFETAPREEATEAFDALPELPFTLPGEQLAEGAEPHVYTAVRPKQAIWARAAAAGSPRTPLHLRITAMLEFFDATLDEADRAVFASRFEDPRDPLDLADVLPVVAWLAKEWGAKLPATGNRAERRRR